jgi:hypothetical protein
MPGTSSGQLAFVKETVAGATPATPAFKIVDITSEDLSLTATQTRSAAVTPQRVVRSSRRTGKEVGNGFSFELYKGTEIDALLLSLLGRAGWTALVAKAGGLVQDSYTFERKIAADSYRRFLGCQIGSMAFTIAPETIVGVRTTVVGYSQVNDVAAITGATYTDATAGEKLTALDVTSVTLSGGVTSAVDFESITLTVNNQKTARKRIGPNSVRGVSDGQTLVTGTARAYVDSALSDAFLTDTAFNWDIPFAFGGEGYSFLLKNVKQTTNTDPITGNQDEFMSNFDFEATLDAAYGSSFGISKTS